MGSSNRTGHFFDYYYDRRGGGEIRSAAIQNKPLSETCCVHILLLPRRLILQWISHITLSPSLPRILEPYHLPHRESLRPLRPLSRRSGRTTATLLFPLKNHRSSSLTTALFLSFVPKYFHISVLYSQPLTGFLLMGLILYDLTSISWDKNIFFCFHTWVL